jgi:hypothetical protein
MIVNVGGEMLTRDSLCRVQHLARRIRAYETDPAEVTCPDCLSLLAARVARRLITCSICNGTGFIGDTRCTCDKGLRYAK